MQDWGISTALDLSRVIHAVRAIRDSQSDHCKALELTFIEYTRER